MKTRFVVLGCLAVTGLAVWYFFIKDKDERVWEEEGNDPVGPIENNDETKDVDHSNSHLREVMHAAKELTL
jgi:hypothetical protein